MPRRSGTSSKNGKKSGKKPSKTSGRGMERKEELVELVRSCVDEYDWCYVFDLRNARTAPMKSARLALRDEGRFVFGRCKVMQVALGKRKEDAYAKNSEKLAEQLTGSGVGLFFTNISQEELAEKLAAVKELDFARTGSIAVNTIEVVAGPLVGQPSSMCEQLRAMALPVKLDKGVVVLEQDHVICRAGDKLTSEQARALKAFGVKMSEFSIRLLWRWDCSSGKLAQLEKREAVPHVGTRRGNKKMEVEDEDEDEDEEDEEDDEDDE